MNIFYRTLIFGLLCTSAPAVAESIAFLNVNVIPMTREAVLTDMTVIVSGGRISTIGDVREVPIPEGMRVVDGTDRYLMPGLSEMHGHIPGGSAESLERVLGLYVANGITLTRGMLGQPSHIDLREKIDSGEVLGPRFYTSGPSFNGRSVSSPDQAARMVREQHAAGYDFLKIHPGIDRDEFDAIARTANELNIPFAGHVPADVGVERALALGIATIDHLDGYMQTLIPANEDPSGGFDGFFGLLLAPQADDTRIGSIVSATRDAGTWNVPTESLFEHVVNEVSVSDLRGRSEMKYMPAGTVDRWAKSKSDVLADPNYSVDTARMAIEIRHEILRQLNAAGAGLLLGSDSPQIFNVPGFAIHRELRMLVDAGLSPYDALRTGTVNPAKFFGMLTEWGTVEVGKQADLVLLDQNPLADISASRRVHGVMLRGRWVSRPEIDAILDGFKR